MASTATKNVPKVQDSLIVCTTSLPKRQLFSKWVISDAKVFLERKEKDGLKSQNFSVPLPNEAKCGKDQQQTTLWYLKVYREKKLSLGLQVVGESESVDYLYICLYQGSRGKAEGFWFGTSVPNSGLLARTTCVAVLSPPEPPRQAPSKICITDCKFEILNPDTGEPMYTKASEHGSSVECTICNDCPVLCGHISVKYADVERFVSQDTLIIQVQATILCLSDLAESVLREEQAPRKDNVLEGVKNLFNAKLFADVMIKCGDAEFKAHKAILASQSPVFRRMLESDMKEQRTNVIEISDVDQAVISDMLAYIYTGCVPHLDALVAELLEVANKYELSELFAMCEDKLKADMKVDNVIELLILADMHNASRLKGTCLNYICLNSAAVLNTSQWKELKKNCDRHASLLVEIVNIALQ